MVKCIECGKELAPDAKFCPSCGTQVGVKKEVFELSPDKLIEKFKEITKDASVKRIVVKDESGKTLISMPMTWGLAGALATVALAPRLAALGVIAGIVTRVTLEVEKAPTVMEGIQA